VHPNDIFDVDNPAASLYKRHIISEAYGCPICKEHSGSVFAGIEIDARDLIHFKYHCNLCGSTSEKVFSLEEIRLLTRQYAQGDESTFFECWYMVRFYPHLINDFQKYKQFVEILRKPERSRWVEAARRLWRYLTMATQTQYLKEIL
jgi:hypothetical protein